jgi:Nucleolar complex-associated protein
MYLHCRLEEINEQVSEDLVADVRTTKQLKKRAQKAVPVPLTPEEVRQRVAMASAKLVEAPESNSAQLRLLLEAARHVDPQVCACVLSDFRCSCMIVHVKNAVGWQLLFLSASKKQIEGRRFHPASTCPTALCVQVSKLALVSLLAVFKNIVPGYKIRDLTESELDVKVVILSHPCCCASC